MDCPHCHSSSTREREGRTVQGFRRFRCRDCGRRFNERTGTALNRVQVPTDIVFLVVFWRLRYKLSLRDLAEMFGLMYQPPPEQDGIRSIMPHGRGFRISR
jgi:putative transposase